MERMHRGWLAAALLGLGLSWAPASAQDAESPYLDIQWNSRVVQLMLPIPAGLCQADANRDAAPIESEYDSGNEWQRPLRPSMLRAMFYLAYDYYGMGLNHYFTLRQDITPDFFKRLALSKQLNAPWAPPDYATAFMPAKDAGALTGDVEIPSKGGDNATMIHFRHAVIDPFDLGLLADRIHRYRAVGLSPRGKRATPMDSAVDLEDIHYYRFGTVRDSTGAERMLGLVLAESFSYPGIGPDREPNHQTYSYQTKPLLAHASSPEMLHVVVRSTKSAVCEQWRMQQERERAGQSTETDRLLKALMQRAGIDDERDGLWVIPAEGY